LNPRVPLIASPAAIGTRARSRSRRYPSIASVRIGSSTQYGAMSAIACRISVAALSDHRLCSSTITSIWSPASARIASSTAIPERSSAAAIRWPRDASAARSNGHTFIAV
jgi:hypothetical protein